MKYYSTLIIMLFSFCNAHPKPEEVIKPSVIKLKEDTLQLQYLQELAAQYGENKLITAIFLTDKKFAASYSGVIDSMTIPWCRLEDIFKRANNTIHQTLSGIDSSLALLTEKERKLITGRVDTLLKNDILLSSVVNDHLFIGLEFGEIVNSIVETKPLLDQYLKDPKQYWGSLDLNQSCKLYYDVLLYSTSLNQQNRIRFFTSYFNTACKIAGKN